MAIAPNIIFHQVVSGSTITGVEPAITDVVNDVERQLRGRIWKYKGLADGGLFRSPIVLASDESQARVKPMERSKHAVTDIYGATLQRVMFSGAGTSRVQGLLVDPAGAEESVTGEGLTPAPAFDGAQTGFTTTISNTPIIAGTVTITTSAGVGSENFTDDGDGTLTGSGGGSGTINYDTGAVALTYNTAPAGGLTLSADYSYVTASVEYEFFDTDAITGIDPASFTYDMNPQSGVVSNLILLPGWHIRFITTGALTGPGSLGVMFSPGIFNSQVQGVDTYGVKETL